MTDAKNEPVREWLKGLDEDIRKEIGSDVQVVQWRWPIGKPLVDGFKTPKRDLDLARKRQRQVKEDP